MTPPAAATAAARSEARTSAPPRRASAARTTVPRRVSGPSRPGRTDREAARTRIDAGRANTAPRAHFRLRGVAGLAGATGQGAIALPARGIRAAARTVPEGTGLLDRLLRGRGIIAVVAALLIGLVFLQVSLLKLNAGIGRDVGAATTYERENASLRAQISNLAAGARVNATAAKQGMVMPNPDQVRYLRAKRAGGVGGAGGAALAQTQVDPATGQAVDPAATDPSSSDPSTTDPSAGTTDPTQSADQGVGTAPAPVDQGATDQTASAQPSQPDPSAVATATGAAQAPSQ